MSDLVNRLRGKYRIPITDGLGPAGGEEPGNADFFVRSFPTSPLAMEAADHIEQLEAQLAEARFLVERLTDFDNDGDVRTTEGERDWSGLVVPSLSRLKGLLGDTP